MTEHHYTYGNVGLIILLVLLSVQSAHAYGNGLPSPENVREIVADVPRRVDPSMSNIPVLFFINDALQKREYCSPGGSACEIKYSFVQLNFVDIYKNGGNVGHYTYNI